MTEKIKTAAYFKEGFRQLEEELQLVTGVLREALPLDDDLLSLIPWREESATKIPDGRDALAAQLLSLSFEVLNKVEERVAFRFRSWRRSHHGPAAVSGLWPFAIEQLVKAGCSEKEVLAALREVRVEPVLTAHPTEAKRHVVREKHLAIYNALTAWEAAAQDPHRARRLRGSLRAELESLWFTGEIFIRRPKVRDELQNAIYYLREVFPEVVLRLDRSLELAWEDAGWSVGNLRDQNAYPSIQFATWIGGDRDGHPFVTPEVTAGTLAELRRHAARLHRRFLRRAAQALTLAPPFARVPDDFRDALHHLAQEFGSTGQDILDRNPHEPWRAYLYLLREKMGRTAEQGGYTVPDDYRFDLARLHESLVETGAKYSADEWVRPLLRLSNVFGFHLAAVDIRQNSTAYDQAATELFVATGVKDATGFASWDEPRRRKLVLEELRKPDALTKPGDELGEAAANAIEALRVFAKHSGRFGDSALGQLIVSMTRQPSDLLLVHLFCREAGLADRDDDGQWRSRLPVSPLFETGADLAAAEEILRDYLDAVGPAPNGLQPAMVGYSDSNKDAGVFSSQWGIFLAQESIARACQDHGVKPQFFHGRGGTIGRGAGPTQWFLRALPPGSLSGSVRITEQGEVLPRKYAHEGNAHYQLELLMAGVSEAAATQSRHEPLGDDIRDALQHIADDSSAAYRALLESDGFLDFHRSATPIDALEAGTFGSRPPRRTGGGARKTLEDLRAIPWVFSWTQSRFYLPGWFGVGSGLAALEKKHAANYGKLRESLPANPFLQYVLTNVESSLASAKPELMEVYAALCDDKATRARILDTVRSEYDLTRKQLAAFLGRDFRDRRPRLAKTLDLREKPLRLLHDQQIALLRDWRQAARPVQDDTQSGKFDRTFLALQLTINAISSGLRETG
ncbi:MAG: phosphoenolpyruvate carboxylase [Akkermansiaceae bacterium]|nr:phosphoenolpyruvate carboxylase [Akkermansiaceae bacterium]